MDCRVLQIDYGFSYPEGCTREQLAEELRKLARGWSGWERFPWRVTRHLHKFLDVLPVNFHYLMIHQCLAGYAAHLVLTAEFEDRDAVLALLVRERFQIVGAARMLMIEALRTEMKRTGLPYILDASGPEEGHRHLTEEEVTRRQVCFRKCVEGAAAEYVMILNVASLADGLKGSSLGHSLRYWASGGELPAAVSLEVQARETERGTVIKPCVAEVRAITNAMKPVPHVVFDEAGEEPVGQLAVGSEAVAVQWAVMQWATCR